MNRKVLSVVLMLALLAGGVGLGIHILHKDALAQNVTFIVMIDWIDDDRDDEVETVTITTRDPFGQVVDVEQTDYVPPNTWFLSFEPNTQSVTWSAEVTFWKGEIEFLEGNPQNMGDIDWENVNQGFFTEW